MVGSGVWQLAILGLGSGCVAAKWVVLEKIVMRAYALFLILFFALSKIPLVFAQDSLVAWEEKILTFEETGQSDSVDHYYPLILAAYRNADDLEYWLYSYWDWQAYWFDDTEKALTLLRTAKREAWRAPQTPAEKEALLWVDVNRGYHLFQSGRVSTSVDAYEAALALYEQYRFSDFPALDYLYLPLGAHYTRLGDNEKARALYEKAIAEYQASTTPEILAGLYNNLGLTYWNEDRQQQAISIYRAGLALDSLPISKRALLLRSLGQSLLEQGQIDEANRLAREALDLLQKVQRTAPDTEGLPGYLSGAWLLLANVQNTQGQGQAIFPALRRALNYAITARGTEKHRSVAKIRVALGNAYVQAGNPAAAHRQFTNALTSLLPSYQPQEPYDLPDSATFYGENAIYEALAGKADALLALSTSPADTTLHKKALACHLLASQAEWILRRLLQYESSRINLLTQSRDRIEDAIGVARTLWEQTGDNQYLYQAWAFAEQVKSAVLLDAIQRNRVQQSSTNNDILWQQARRVRQQLAYYERQLLLNPQSEQRPVWLTERDDLMDQMDRIEEKLARRYPAWSTVKQSTQVQTERDIVQLLRSHTSTTIEFFVGRKHIDVFVHAPDGTATWTRTRQPNRILALTRKLRGLLQSRQALQDATQYGATAHQLYQKLLHTALPSADTAGLLIIPDAWLSAIPFAALYYRPATEAGWAQAPFLLQRHQIQYAFSLAVLASQQQAEHAATKNILHLAPRFIDHPGNLPPLRYSETELSQLDRCGVQQYLDERATFTPLREHGADYLVVHLSTHAQVDSAGQNPRISFFDHQVFMPEIYALSLNAELVILSACETGLGAFEQGEGIMSLSRAFTYAGARGLISSLWRINESTTAQIIAHTYAELNHGATKAQALHRAKMHYLNDQNIPGFQKSPYYWAGLVYIGDNKTISWQPCPSSPWWIYGGIGALLLVLLGWWKYWREL